MEDKSPIWTRWAPLIVGGGYFIYAYWINKSSLTKSVIYSALLALGASVPWFMANRNKPMPAIFSGVITADVTGNADINAMNRAGRQAVVDYIIKREGEIAAANKSVERKVKQEAYASLTNDELKALYLVYKFVENKDELLKTYGSTTDDATAKKVAKEKFGIDAGSIKNLRETSGMAIAKISKYYSTQPI